MASVVSMFRENNGPRGAVPNSLELQRVLALPRRKLDLGAVPDATALYRTPQGRMKLLPIQSAALFEAAYADGLIGSIAVGCGKTLITLLLPDAMGSDRAVLFVPAQVKRQLLERMIPEYRLHFRLPEIFIFDPFQLKFSGKGLYVLSYEELSSAKKADALTKIDPDLVILDEAQKFRHAGAVRTKRFNRFFREHPEVRLAILSGTLTSKSLMDYAHLAVMALRKNTPLPMHFNEQIDWAAALDVTRITADGDEVQPMKPGALSQLCERGEHVRSGFRRRFIETRGVVATSEQSIGTSLYIKPITMPMPADVAEFIQTVRDEWMIGDEAFPDALTYYRILRQLAAGFYYRWVWPGGVKDEDWIRARKDWHKEMRSFLTHGSRPGLDSPMLVTKAAIEGRWEPLSWKAWDKVRHRLAPPTETVWVSDFFVKEAVARARVSDLPTIVWYEQKALGARVAELGGFPLYDADRDPGTAKENLIVASIRSHGTGKNLQQFSNNLILTMPSGGATCEQLLGRTHRQGQQADEVWVQYYAHTDELRGAFETARRDAQYIQDTQSSPQKLCFATYL